MDCDVLTDSGDAADRGDALRQMLAQSGFVLTRRAVEAEQPTGTPSPASTPFRTTGIAIPADGQGQVTVIAHPNGGVSEVALHLDGRSALGIDVNASASNRITVATNGATDEIVLEPRR